MLIVGLVLSLLALMMACQAACASIDRRKFPAPGSMISIPGGRIHIRQLGQGQPAAILEAGIAASCLSWSLAQPQLASLTSTYSYDRPGLGWSSSNRSANSLAEMAEDLHAWVATLPLAAPYILVAHSFGAYIVTAFAQRFHHELAGVVLVDPLTPEEWLKPSPEQTWRLRRGVWFSRAGGLLAALGVVRACLWLLQRGNREAPRGVLRLFGTQATETVEHILGELAKLPAEVTRVVRARWSRPPFFWTMANYIRSLPACAAEIEGSAVPAQVPVTVISGAHQPEIRLREHAAIAASSLHGRHVIASASAHWVHLDQPDLVAKAVQEIIETTRGIEPRVYNAECGVKHT